MIIMIGLTKTNHCAKIIFNIKTQRTFFMEQPPKKNQINIELTEDVAEGIYSNLAIISHSSSEFYVDFVRIMPGLMKAKVKSRIILTPQHAKRLLTALQDNVIKFEAQNGTIEEGNPYNDLPPINFGGPPPSKA